MRSGFVFSVFFEYFIFYFLLILIIVYPSSISRKRLGVKKEHDTHCVMKRQIYETLFPYQRWTSYNLFDWTIIVWVCLCVWRDCGVELSWKYNNVEYDLHFLLMHAMHIWIHVDFVSFHVHFTQFFSKNTELLPSIHTFKPNDYFHDYIEEDGR